MTSSKTSTGKTSQLMILVMWFLVVVGLPLVVIYYITKKDKDGEGFEGGGCPLKDNFAMKHFDEQRRIRGAGDEYKYNLDAKCMSNLQKFISLPQLFRSNKNHIANRQSDSLPPMFDDNGECAREVI